MTVGSRTDSLGNVCREGEPDSSLDQNDLPGP